MRNLFTIFSLLCFLSSGPVWGQLQNHDQLTGTGGTDPTAAEDRSAPDYVSRINWSWVTNSSCTDDRETGKDGNIKALFDNNTTSHWHSAYNANDGGTVALPNYVKIDLSVSTTFYGFAYYPRTDGSQNGKVTSWRLYYSDTDFSETDISAILGTSGSSGESTDESSDANADENSTDNSSTEETTEGSTEGTTETKTYTYISGTFSYTSASSYTFADAIKYGYIGENGTTAVTARYVLFVVDASSDGTFASGAEFYLLKSDKAKIEARTALYKEIDSWSDGEWVGTYDKSQSTHYTTALEDATSATATTEEITTKTASLKAERTDDKIVKLQDVKMYQFVSAYAGFTSEYALCSVTNTTYGYKSLSTPYTTDLSFYWRVYPNATTSFPEGCRIQSLDQTTFVNNITGTASADKMGTTDHSAGPCMINAIDATNYPGQYYLTIGNTKPMYANTGAQGSALQVTPADNSGVNSRSAWRIRQVDIDKVAAAFSTPVTSGFNEGITTGDGLFGMINYLRFSTIKANVQTTYDDTRIGFGTGYGYYTLPSCPNNKEGKEEIKSWLDDYAAVTGQNVNEFPSTYQSAYNSITYNTPASGTFIRVRSADYTTSVPNAYMSNWTETKSTARVAYQAEADNQKTVFYYSNNYLLNYSTGYYVINSSNFPSYNGVSAATSYAFEKPTSTSAQPGEFYIKFAGSRYQFCVVGTYGQGIGYADAGGSTDDRAGYRFTVEDVEALGVTISDAGCATFCSPVAVTLPTGVQAYIGSVTQRDGGNVLTLTELTGEIPANTGVVLFAEEGTYDLPINKTPANTQDVTSDDLMGTIASTAFVDGSYTLQVIDGKVGFYQYAATDSETLYMNGFRAYLPASKIPSDTDDSSETRGLSIEFGNSQTTGIATATSTAAAKGIYDLSGRRVNHLAKGLYIINGQKVLVK